MSYFISQYSIFFVCVEKIEEYDYLVSLFIIFIYLHQLSIVSGHLRSLFTIAFDSTTFCGMSTSPEEKPGARVVLPEKSTEKSTQVPEKTQEACVDLSGSMMPYLPELRYLAETSLSQYALIGFHDLLLRNIKPKDFEKSMGMTNLEYPFIRLRELIPEILKYCSKGKRLSASFVLVTDGAHNATPVSCLYNSIMLFLRLLRTVYRENIVLKFNIITCGEWYDKQLVAAIPAMWWMICQEQKLASNVPDLAAEIRGDVEITVAKIEEVNKTSFGKPVVLEDIDAIKGLSSLIRFLPEAERPGVVEFVNQYIAYIDALYPSKTEESVAAPKTFHDMINYVLKKSDVKPMNQSDKLRDAFKTNGHDTGTGSKKDGHITFLKKLSELHDPDHELCLATLKDDNMVEGLARGFQSSGDISWFLDPYFKVVFPLATGKWQQRGFMETLATLQTVNTQYPLVCTRAEKPFPFNDLLPDMLNRAQFTVLNAIGKNYATLKQVVEFRNTVFYQALLATRDDARHDLVTTVLQTISQAYEKSLISESTIRETIDKLRSDIAVKQGNRQKFEDNDGVIIPHLVTIMSLLLFPDGSSCVDTTRLSDVLAVYGMLVRFSLDAKNFSIVMLLNSDIDIDAFARLQLFLSKMDKKSIQECAIASNRNSNALESSTRTTYKEAITAAFDTKLPEPDDSEIFTEDEIATIFWLTGIKNFTDLAKQVRDILGVCERKTKDNTGDRKDIYAHLNKMIRYLPNEALKIFNGVLCNMCPTVKDAYGWNEVSELLKCSKYATSMKAFFMEPPVASSGWKTSMEKEDLDRFSLTEQELDDLVAYVGNNVGMFPPTEVRSSVKIQSALNRGNDFKRTHEKIHSSFWHPKPRGELKSSEECVCGMPFFTSHVRRATISYQVPVGESVVKRKIEANIIAPLDRTAHLGSWALFKEMKPEFKVEENIAVIKKRLGAKPDSRRIELWAEQNGGKTIWQRANISELMEHPEASLRVDELLWFGGQKWTDCAEHNDVQTEHGASTSSHGSTDTSCHSPMSTIGPIHGDSPLFATVHRASAEGKPEEKP